MRYPLMVFAVLLVGCFYYAESSNVGDASGDNFGSRIVAELPDAD